MYIKVKVQDNGAGDGGNGLVTAIDWAMTASAAASPDVSTLNSGNAYGEISSLQVISNREAGGWERQTLTVNNSSYSFDGNWQTASPKTGRSYKKRFGVRSVGSVSTYGNWGPDFSLYDADADTLVVNRSKLQYSQGTNSSTDYRVWMGNREPDEASWWHISVTNKYCWFWSTNSLGGGFGRIGGIGDLAGTPAHKLAAADDTFNSVAFYLSNINTSASAGSSSTVYKHDFIAYYFANIHPGIYYPNQAISSTGAQTSISSSNHSNTNSLFPWRYGPSHYENVVSQYSQGVPLFDSSGQISGSMMPVVIHQPWYGVPYQTIEGIYWYIDKFTQNTTEAGIIADNTANHGRIVEDSNGDKYVLVKFTDDLVTYAVRAE